MLRLISLLLLTLSSFSCRNLYEAPRPYQVYAKPASYFDPLVNKAEGQQLLVLENAEYPIELTLYKDQTFRYHLAKLGDGAGTWSFADGHLALYAERKLFVMRMQLHSLTAEDNPEAIALEFSDRFGPKFLHLTVKRP